MAEGKRRVDVTIFGEAYVVIGNANSDKIEGLATSVDKKMRLIAQRNPRLSTYKIAVLAALNLAEELSRLKQEHQALVRLMDEDR